MTQQQGPILIFDGVCNICSFGVRTILRADRQGLFRYAFGQGPVGRRLKADYGLTEGDLENVALIEDGRAYVKSDAVLRVVRRLPYPWSLLRVFGLLPRSVRNPLYSLVARNRYRWFGKRTACFMPAPEHEKKFLDHP